jgi:hypothetical protein
VYAVALGNFGHIMLDFVFKREQQAQLHAPFEWADVERTTKIISTYHSTKQKDDTIDRHEYALLELLRLNYISDDTVKSLMDKYDVLDKTGEGQVPVGVLLEREILEPPVRKEIPRRSREFSDTSRSSHQPVDDIDDYKL